jgi:RNA polymerase sigma-70 factor, ECF subfamily
MRPTKQKGSSAGNSSALLRDVGNGHNEAWDRLVSLYRPRILRACRAKGLDEASSHDVAQDAFVTVYRSLASFRASPGSGAFRAWLHTIVERRIADWYRRTQRQPKAVGGSTFAEQIHAIPADCEEASEDRSFSTILGKDLEHVAEKYEPRTWQAFLRCVVDGRSTEDVAIEFGMTAVGVRQLRSRILRHLRNG